MKISDISLHTALDRATFTGIAIEPNRTSDPTAQFFMMGFVEGRIVDEAWFGNEAEFRAGLRRLFKASDGQLVGQPVHCVDASALATLHLMAPTRAAGTLSNREIFVGQEVISTVLAGDILQNREDDDDPVNLGIVRQDERWSDTIAVRQERCYGGKLEPVNISCASWSGSIADTELFIAALQKAVEIAKEKAISMCDA